MKPIVIYLDKHEDEIKLTRKEFEEYINKAYDQGYACGYAEGKKSYPWWQYNGSTITTTNTFPQPKEVYYGTGKEYNPNRTEVTCSNDTNSIFASGLFIHGDDAVEKIVPCDAHNDI